MINTRRRLGVADTYLNALEPNGGFLPSQVTTGINRKLSGKNVTDEDACPEESLLKPNFNGVKDFVFTPEILGGLARTDEIGDTLERMASYIAIVPDIGSSFAYIDVVPGSQLTLEGQDRLITDARMHWHMVQDFLFAKQASLQLGIHRFIQSWLTYGQIYFAIVRDKQFGIPIDIHVQFENFKNCKTMKGEYWETDFNQVIWEKEDMFVLDWMNISDAAPSFVASVMRTYNLWRTIERTRVANAVMSAQFRSIYSVPTAGLGKVKARQKLSTVMSMYKREIKIDDITGQTTINGENSYPVNTELWVSETSNGSVRIENPGDGNPSLNNTDLVEYFMRKYYKRGKLPMSKYEAVDAGYLSGISEIDEDERQFKLFNQNCRAVIAKVFLDIIWRLMSPLKQYSGREDFRKALCMTWYDEPDSETPSEQLEHLGDALDNVNDLLDKYKETLENSGFAERQITARINVLRVKLMRKYCPDLLEQTQEDYTMVPTEESTDSSEGGSWDSSGSDYDMSSGSDDYGDWGNDDYENSFGESDNMGSDWSMPEETSDSYDSEW